MNKSILALAVSAFGIGTSEFIIVGLLPDLARSFSVSVPTAGALVTAYALGVTFGSPLLALALAHTERKRSLLILMGVFVLGNIACALAPNYVLLLCARVLTALCHGAFFGIGSVVAANAVPREQRSQAIALMFTGLTLANVLGVPAGTALGQAFGWRSVFFALVPIGVAAGLALFFLVPEQEPEEIHLGREFRAVIRPQVQLVLSLSTLSSVALFCVFTYIAPILESVTRLSPHAVTLVLMLFGVGITIGMIVGGRLGDWKQMPFVIGGLGVLLAIFLVMPYAEPHAFAAISLFVFWGLIHFATISPLQARIVDKAHGAPNLASTLNQGAFNLGNALGATLGGLVLTAGYGYRHLSSAAAVVIVICFVVAVIMLRSEKNQASKSHGYL